MKNKKIISFLILMLLLANNATVFAQCAMCKTTASSDLESGGSIGTGLNSGIFYLIGTVYLILMTGAYFFFKEAVDAKVKAWKDKLFSAK